MVNMARRDAPGDYQIGIYNVRRERKKWIAQATGPGTIGDGIVGTFATLEAAHFALTGEHIHDDGYKEMVHYSRFGAGFMTKRERDGYYWGHHASGCLPNQWHGPFPSRKIAEQAETAFCKSKSRRR